MGPSRIWWRVGLQRLPHCPLGPSQECDSGALRWGYCASKSTKLYLGGFLDPFPSCSTGSMAKVVNTKILGIRGFKKDVHPTSGINSSPLIHAATIILRLAAWINDHNATILDGKGTVHDGLYQITCFTHHVRSRQGITARPSIAPCEACTFIPCWWMNLTNNENVDKCVQIYVYHGHKCMYL